MNDDRPTDVLSGYEQAWGLIANARDWLLTDPQAQEWRDAAMRWRDEVWHPALDGARDLPEHPAVAALVAERALSDALAAALRDELNDHYPNDARSALLAHRSARAGGES